MQYLDTETPKVASYLVTGACVLHNFAIARNDIMVEEYSDEIEDQGDLDVDEVYGVDNLGLDKREAIMASLPQRN